MTRAEEEEQEKKKEDRLSSALRDSWAYVFVFPSFFKTFFLRLRQRRVFLFFMRRAEQRSGRERKKNVLTCRPTGQQTMSRSDRCDVHVLLFVFLSFSSSFYSLSANHVAIAAMFMSSCSFSSHFPLHVPLSLSLFLLLRLMRAELHGHLGRGVVADLRMLCVRVFVAEHVSSHHGH